MKHLGSILTLSLLSFSALASYPDEINYPHYQRIYQNHADELSRLTSQYQDNDLSARRLYSEIQSLQTTFNNYSNERASNNNELTRLSNENRQLISQRDRLIIQDRDLTNKANRARSDVDRFKRDYDSEERRIRPIRDQLDRVNRDVTSIRNNHSQAQRNLQSSQNDLRQLQSNLSRVRSDISRLEGVPNRTPAQQSQLDNLRRQRSTLESQISSKNIEVASRQGTVNQLSQQLSMKENELRNLQAQYNRESQRLNQIQTSLNNAQRELNRLNNELNATRTSLNNTERRLASIRTEVSRLQARNNDIERAQYTLRSQIDSSTNRYNSLVRELERLATAVERKRAEVATSQYEFEKRADLYNKFLADAQELGRSQVVTASTKGEAQGVKDAEKKGKSLGNDIGLKSGAAAGNLWGAVRAEVKGYNDGYEIGYNSPRTDAQNAADKDAAKAAKTYAETVLRPGYFEDVVQEEIKKPFASVKKLEVPFVQQVQFFAPTHSLEVSDSEMSASDRLVTSYDSVIAQFKNEKLAIDAEFGCLSEAVNSYAQQTSYPYDKFNCSNVYKGVSDFKKACEDYFYAQYANTFESAAYDSYLRRFDSFFTEAFTVAFETNVKKQYDLSYKRAYEATKVFGEQEGKKDMYNEAYELQYAVSYKQHLETEKARVRKEVVGELASFLDANALLTMVGLETNEEVIAGDTLTISSLIRNLGKSKAAIAHLNIVSSNGVEVVTKKVTTPEIKGRSQSKVAGPVVKVLPELTSGKTFRVEVEATLPGDNYKSERKERLVLEKKVSINPQQTLKLNVDTSPSIRNVLRRFLIHTLSVEVSPKFEDLKTELDVNLVVLSGSEHTELKVATQKVPKMKSGSKTTIKYSYVFKDSANGNTIKMALQFLYKGKVVQTEHIELRPH